VEESGLDAPWDERIDLRIFGNLCAVGIADLTELENGLCKPGGEEMRMQIC